MSDRPQPPAGSQYLDTYAKGAQVYYYRSGTTIQAAGRMAAQVWLICGQFFAGKWRLAQIRSTESSGKRYVVS